MRSWGRVQIRGCPKCGHGDRGCPKHRHGDGPDRGGAKYLVTSVRERLRECTISSSRNNRTLKINSQVREGERTGRRVGTGRDNPDQMVGRTTEGRTWRRGDG